MFSVKFSSRIGQDTTALFLWEYLSNVIPYKFQNQLAEFHEKSLWNSNYGCIASLDQFRENRHFYSIWSSIQEHSTDLHIFVFLNIHWILNVVVGDLQIPVWNPFQNFLKWSPPNLRALFPPPLKKPFLVVLPATWTHVILTATFPSPSCLPHWAFDVSSQETYQVQLFLWPGEAERGQG